MSKPNSSLLLTVLFSGSDDDVTTSFQWSQNSRPPMLDHQDKDMMKAQSILIVIAIMSSSLSHATATHTSMSSDDDVPSWGIPLMDVCESDPKAPEAAPQSLDQAPLSPAHALVHPEYLM
nr:hypothetical protein [Tanacetum cinerariifolium]